MRIPNSGLIDTFAEIGSKSIRHTSLRRTLKAFAVIRGYEPECRFAKMQGIVEDGDKCGLKVAGSRIDDTQYLARSRLLSDRFIALCPAFRELLFKIDGHSISSIAHRPEPVSNRNSRVYLLLGSNRVALDGGLVPIEARTGAGGNPDFAVLDLERFLENRIGPVLPFQPMGGFCRTHEMRGKFRIEVGRHLYSGGARDGGSTEPAGDAADPHQVRHDKVTGACCDGLRQRAGSIEIFAKLNRCFQVARQLRITSQVVVGDRLFEPIDVLVVKRVTAMQRLAQGQALIEIDHQADIGSNALAHLVYGVHIIDQPVASQTQLQCLEAAFGDQELRFIGECADIR